MSAMAHTMDGVGLTSLWVAAIRANETDREGGLFRDPFARALAGERGFEVLAKAKAANPIDVPTIPVRTRWIDERIAEARSRGLDQMAMLAAGMDARAWRLDALAGVDLYEIDREFVLAYKRERIGGAAPKCTRREVAIDLRDDWAAALRASGFDPSRPTIWLVEGLLVYLLEPHVRALFATIDSLAAPKSELLFDMVGQSLLDSPYMTSTLDMVRELGAPWTFGNDEPASLMPPSWDAIATDFGDIGRAYGRWPFPEAPPGVPGVPRSFLVRATKR